jgi:hypothetical protein
MNLESTNTLTSQFESGLPALSLPESQEKVEARKGKRETDEARFRELLRKELRSDDWRETLSWCLVVLSFACWGLLALSLFRFVKRSTGLMTKEI